MATLSVQTVDLDGITLSTAAAAAGGDVFANTGREVFYVVNGSGGDITVTFTGQSASNFGVTSNKAVTVANGATKIIGPFLPAWFDNGSNQVAVSYSGVSSVTVAAIKVTDATTAL